MIFLKHHKIDRNVLTDRIVLITGGGRGIGRGAAQGFSQYGARVAIVSEPGTEEELEHTVKIIESDGGQAMSWVCDIRDQHQVEHTITEIETRLGLIDVLVNNAAVMLKKPFENITSQQWHDAISVSLHGSYYCARAVYPGMLKRNDGAIINISSSAGYRGSYWGTSYCTGKFALEGLAQSLAQEAKTHNILVTLATPGISTKPTSVTEAMQRQMSEQETAQFVDPKVLTEGFCYLGIARHPILAGRRFNLFRLSEAIRENGFELDEDRVLDCQEGPFEVGRDIL